MCFDPELYAKFCDDSAKSGIQIPVLPGSRVLKSQKQAHRLSSRFGVSVPQSYIDRLPEVSSKDSGNQAVDLFMEQVESFKKYGAPGIHIFVLSDTQRSCNAIQRLTKTELKS